ATHFPTPAMQIANDIPHIFIRHDHLNVHYRFQENRLSPPGNLFKCHRSGDLECQFRGINLMIRPVVHSDFDVNDWIPGYNTALQRLLHTSFYSRDVLLRDHATDNGIFKDKPFPARQRFEAQSDMPVLSTSTALTDEFSLTFC